MAHAQWMWLDANGSKIYSDRPPPANIPDKNIIKKPANAAVNAAKSGSTSASDATTTASGASSSNSAANPNPSGTTPSPNTGNKNELDAKKKKAEAEAEAKRQAEQKAEDDRIAKARAENCRRAQGAKAQLEMGTPMRAMDGKGERVLMDEAMRAAEIQRAQQVIQSDCGPMPAKK
jgi:hypothetical protein